ncbi:MAG: hypothetical protein ACXADF_15105 [Candidatus Thorarchaeota archaeon]
MKERESILNHLARRWNLYAIIDFSLGIMLLTELVTGLPAADMGLHYYIALHLPVTALISFAAGIVLSSFMIRFRSPFRPESIDPAALLLSTLEILVEAAKPEEGGGQGYVDSILLRVVAQEIESFMENRAMGEGERGRFLEYLSEHEGVIGEVASSLLWPL